MILTFSKGNSYENGRDGFKRNRKIISSKQIKLVNELLKSWASWNSRMRLNNYLYNGTKKNVSLIQQML